jgi:hypothetical protein
MKNKQDTHRYESVTLGLPPLKMILVETDAQTGTSNPKKKPGSRKTQKTTDERQVILKIINHLTGTDK